MSARRQIVSTSIVLAGLFGPNVHAQTDPIPNSAVVSAEDILDRRATANQGVLASDAAQKCRKQAAAAAAGRPVAIPTAPDAGDEEAARKMREALAKSRLSSGMQGLMSQFVPQANPQAATAEEACSEGAARKPSTGGSIYDLKDLVDVSLLIDAAELAAGRKGAPQPDSCIMSIDVNSGGGSLKGNQRNMLSAGSFGKPFAVTIVGECDNKPFKTSGARSAYRSAAEQPRTSLADLRKLIENSRAGNQAARIKAERESITAPGSGLRRVD